MALDRLRQLVVRYASSEIDQKSFRFEFVKDFLSQHDLSPSENALVASIEGACADHSEGFIDEDRLRQRVAKIALPTQVATLFTIDFTINEMLLRPGAMVASAMNMADRMDTQAT